MNDGTGGQEEHHHGHGHHGHHKHHRHGNRHKREDKSSDPALHSCGNEDEEAKQSENEVARIDSSDQRQTLPEEQITETTQTKTLSGRSFTPSIMTAQEHAAALDARIDAKRGVNPDVKYHPSSSETHVHTRSEVNPEGGHCAHDDDVDDRDFEGNEDVSLFDVSGKSTDKSDDDADQSTINRGSLDDRFNEEGIGVEDGYYPNVQADVGVMAEIQQEGLVDAAGGIQAYVADAAIDEANVVGIIRTDEEVEREERQQYKKFFIRAVACIVSVIVIIGVPVTLKLTNVIGEEEPGPPPTPSPSFVLSQSPSFMPSSSGFTEVVEKLYPLSGEALKDVVSPQHKAARWITEVDQMDLDDPRFEQRYVMALFYYAMDDPNWKGKTGWLGNESECTWYGVNSHRCNIKGCIDGKVCAINMEFPNDIEGRLPSEIGILTEMRCFEIQTGGLFGQLPPNISNWKMLDTLLLNWNGGLEGTLDVLQNNELLGIVFLNGNQFNGTLDFLPSLSNLQWFEATDNSLGGTLPGEITGLEQLNILKVNNNSLTGNLPNTWDEKSKIEILVFADNDFEGPLPASLGKAKFLRVLHASRNQITGSIPESFYNLENLAELYLDENDMVGELPQTAEPFYDGLQKLSIHSNGFSGRFPVEHFETAEILNVLALHNNDLTGTITGAICQKIDPHNPTKKKKGNKLSVDCNLIQCECCTCYMNGTLTLVE